MTESLFRAYRTIPSVSRAWGSPEDDAEVLLWVESYDGLLTEVTGILGGQRSEEVRDCGCHRSCDLGHVRLDEVDWLIAVSSDGSLDSVDPARELTWEEQVYIEILDSFALIGIVNGNAPRYEVVHGSALA